MSQRCGCSSSMHPLSLHCGPALFVLCDWITGVGPSRLYVPFGFTGFFWLDGISLFHCRVGSSFMGATTPISYWWVYIVLRENCFPLSMQPMVEASFFLITPQRYFSLFAFFALPSSLSPPTHLLFPAIVLPAFPSISFIDHGWGGRSARAAPLLQRIVIVFLYQFKSCQCNLAALIRVRGTSLLFFFASSLPHHCSSRYCWSIFVVGSSCIFHRRVQMAHALISQLYPGDSDKKILARVSRLWHFRDLNDDTNILHTDLVLLDEVGNSTHVQMYRGAIEVLKPLIHEGNVYYIESFTVKDANRTYRPVSNDFMILFSKWTTLEECIDIPADFPAITFSLTPFQEIPSLVDKNIFYVDIMGVITEISSTSTVRPRSRDADSLKRTLQICDASNSTLPVTLWGDRSTAENI